MKITPITETDHEQSGAPMMCDECHTYAYTRADWTIDLRYATLRVCSGHAFELTQRLNEMIEQDLITEGKELSR